MKRRKKNRRIKNTDLQKALRMLIAALCFLLITVILITVIKKFPDFTDGIYTKWSVSVMHTLSDVFSFAKYSIAEILIYVIASAFPYFFKHTHNQSYQETKQTHSYI